MAETDDGALDVLNGLIEAVRDSAAGLERAAGLVRNPRFAALFRARAAARLDLMAQLAADVRALGGEPVQEGSMLGVGHRVFLALRDQLAGDSDRPVVEEVERGESFISDRFDRAARDGGLTGEIGARVGEAAARIGQDYAETIALRQEFA